jgi:hypothetical protein
VQGTRLYKGAVAFEPETHVNTDADRLTEPEAEEPSSLGTRLFNVFAAPGELFEELRLAQPAHSNWVVPLLLSFVVGITFSVVVFSQPDIVSGVFAQQEAALAARVEAGKMTREQADQALAGMEKFSSGTVMMVMGSAGAVIVGGIIFLLTGLLLWLLTSKILRGGISVFKAYELTGLAGMIYVVGSVLTMAVVLYRGDVTAAPNAALFLEKFDPASIAHQLLAALNVVTLWYLVVVSVGVSKLAGRSFGAGAIWVFGFWLVVRSGLAAVSAWWAQLQSKL